jgi:ribosomal protein L31
MTVILSAKQILYLVAIPGTKHPLYLEAQNLIGTPGHIQVLDQKGEAKKKATL